VSARTVTRPVILQGRLQSNSEASAIPADVLKYNDMKGRHDLRNVICELLQRTTMLGLALAPENLVLSAGVSSVLDNVFFLLADEGTSCLIPAPYYHMFDLDLGLKDHVHTWPVHFTDGSDDIQLLEVAFKQAQAARQPARAVLLTNPDNPTGIIYSDERIQAIIEWCVKKRIHCVVDEVYAWSVFPHNAPLKSALCIATNVARQLGTQEEERLWEHVHIVMGLSKDFCASGTTRYNRLFRCYSSWLRHR
jgi:aspartate/methionine/tyrosine aminotransferase